MERILKIRWSTCLILQMRNWDANRSSHLLRSDHSFMAKFRTVALTFYPQVTVSHTMPRLSVLCLWGLPACFPPVTRASDRNSSEERAMLLQLLTHGTDGWASGWSGVRAPCLYPSSPCPFLNALSAEHLQRCSGFVVLNKHIWGRNSTCSQFCKKFHCQHRSNGEKSPLYL